MRTIFHHLSRLMQTRNLQATNHCMCFHRGKINPKHLCFCRWHKYISGDVGNALDACLSHALMFSMIPCKCWMWNPIDFFQFCLEILALDGRTHNTQHHKNICFQLLAASQPSCKFGFLYGIIWACVQWFCCVFVNGIYRGAATVKKLRTKGKQPKANADPFFGQSFMLGLFATWLMKVINVGFLNGCLTIFGNMNCEQIPRRLQVSHYESQQLWHATPDEKNGGLVTLRWHLCCLLIPFLDKTSNPTPGVMPWPQ